MENWLQTINKQTVRYLNHTNAAFLFEKENDALASFAIDDTLATSVGSNLSALTVRLWVHDRTIVLGIPDSRLPHLEKGVQFIKENNYNIIIRNSGGLAVALDEGVLNISIILPNINGLTIHDGYELMFNFIKELLKTYTDKIAAYEIVGSYCPGDYDLSIDGIKFAGISQRRVRDGIAVQIYIDVKGDSNKRASLVRDFYQISKQKETTNYPYPTVNPSVMGSLSDLLQRDITVNELIVRIEEMLKGNSKHFTTSHILANEIDVFHKRYDQMIIRNEKITRME